MNASSPRLYLDFDDVVNSYRSIWSTSLRAKRAGWPRLATVSVPSNDGAVYRVDYPPELVAELNRVVAAGVELVWLTSWRGESALFAEHLGTPLAAWRWLQFPSSKDLPRAVDAMLAGKGAALLDDLDARPTSGPVLWIDNDLATSRPALDAAAERGVATIAPKNMLGLTRAEWASALDVLGVG